MCFDGAATQILLADPVDSCVCGEPHTWFVNRDGRTLCVQCDLARQMQDAAELRERLRLSAREAFRVFQNGGRP